MVAKKILLDFEEYRRLLSYEKKYSELKAQLAREPEQKGEGRDQDLEKIIQTNENQADIAPKPQEILPPLTTPADVIDIDSGGPSDEKSANQGHEENTQAKKPKTESESEDELPEKWWFIGRPSYKH